MLNVKSFRYTSEQHTVVFLFQRNPHGLPEAVYDTLQRLIHDILYEGGKKTKTHQMQHDPGTIQTSIKKGQFSMSQHADSHKDTAHAC